MMESQIETIRGTISQLKSKPKDKKKKVKQEKAPVPSTSKVSHPKPPKQPTTSKKKGKKAVTDDDVLSFEQKKELSDTIDKKLDPAKLERVIQIIHEGVPEIRDVSLVSLLCLLISKRVAEYGRDRTRDRYVAHSSTHPTLQCCRQAFEGGPSKAKSSGKGYWHRGFEAQKYGRRSRGREDSTT